MAHGSCPQNHVSLAANFDDINKSVYDDMGPTYGESLLRTHGAIPVSVRPERTGNRLRRPALPVTVALRRSYPRCCLARGQVQAQRTHVNA